MPYSGIVCQGMFRQYYSADAPETLLERPGVLAVVRFNTECLPPASPGLIPAGLESLSGHHSEVIECAGAQVERGLTGNCYWSLSEHLMCAAVWISPDQCADIERGAQAAYSTLLDRLRGAGYPHPVRFWNFIPDINLGAGDREAYKKFCNGRLAAFSAHGLAPQTFPAASALGHHKRGAVIYALATQSAGEHHENPRQERAYRYPRRYGPSSPSFARATSVRLGRERWVFISGTASILGHATRSPGDLDEQLRTTVANIACLGEYISGGTPALSALRVYLRRRDHLPAARDFLCRCYPGADITYALADICRADLLVEIEAAFAEPDCHGPEQKQNL